MVGYLWAAMICIGILVAGLTGNISVVTPSIFSSAEQAVSLVIGLISIMTFWLGIMKLVERSGLIELVKVVLRPLARFLFPAIDREHPAMNAILMNMSANLLGMGNAATPFGIKAMEEMQTLNLRRKIASDEMCTFLAINTSSISLVPTTVIGLRAATGSVNPTEIVGTTLLASVCSCLAAVLADRMFRQWGIFR
ncbi:MAG TPA: nucleoside recognition protein [Firmicutes bacterium]|nr:nucleoside recognition protein [Bacillota bacterium]